MALYGITLQKKKEDESMTEMTIKDTEWHEAVVEVRKRKMKKRLIVTGICVLALLLVFGSVWLYGYNYSKNIMQKEIDALKAQIEELINTPVVVDPVTPEIVQSVIASQMSDISELASAEYLFTNAARFTDTKHIAGIFDWITEKSFVQKWDGIIKAGVNLEKVSVRVSDNVIIITIPQAEILSYEIDYDSIEVLDEKNNVFNPISVEDKAKFDAATAESMKLRAIENGLLDRAQKNAENIIANLLLASVENIQEYTIEFQIAEN